MNKINTTQKGNDFEDKVFGFINNLLLNEELFVSSKFSLPFKKKSYYSKDREKNIITDISIETTLPNADKYSILVVFECKDYGENHTIPIDDLEEFASKLSQISGHNAKGIMVTSSRFSNTCITYAKNKGIGLIRVINDEMKYEVHRKSRFGEHHISDNIISILKGDSIPTKSHYIVDNNMYDDLISYFLYLKVIDKKPLTEEIKLEVPFLSLEEIEVISENLLPEETNIINYTDLNLILDTFGENQNLKLITNKDLGISYGKYILGKMSFDPMCIHISSNLDIDSHRGRFTLAHELGHYLLHIDYLSGYDEVVDTELSFGSNLIIDSQSSKRIEYQANLFASSLLMPKKAFLIVTNGVFLEEGVNKGRLYLDNQLCNQKLYYNVVSKISIVFKVSIQAVKYRLIRYGLLEDKMGGSL